MVVSQSPFFFNIAPHFSVGDRKANVKSKIIHINLRFIKKSVHTHKHITCKRKMLEKSALFIGNTVVTMGSGLNLTSHRMSFPF